MFFTIDQTGQEEGLKPACALEDPERWFSRWPRDIAYAKSKCEECVFKTRCLKECIEYEEMSGDRRWGVFGALTADERAALKGWRASA